MPPLGLTEFHRNGYVLVSPTNHPLWVRVPFFWIPTETLQRRAKVPTGGTKAHRGRGLSGASGNGQTLQALLEMWVPLGGPGSSRATLEDRPSPAGPGQEPCKRRVPAR